MFAIDLSVPEMIRFFEGLVLDELPSPPSSSSPQVLTKVQPHGEFQLGLGLGSFPASEIYDALGTLLRTKCLTADVTFKQLNERFRVGLSIGAFNYTKKAPILFNVDTFPSFTFLIYPRHVFFISSQLPIYFSAQRSRCEWPFVLPSPIPWCMSLYNGMTV